jgi:hypothetical protein
VPRVIRRKTEARIGSWKGATGQRGLENGSRGIATVRSRYQANISEDTVGWKALNLYSSDLKRSSTTL